jgi:hypothetical protein
MNNEAPTSVHPYSVDLNLHHPSCDPADITQELATNPWFARKRGDVIAGIQHKSTSWLCHFQKGTGNVEFDETLRALVSFIGEHGSFLRKFVEEEGTAEVVLNARVPFDEGKLFDLSLDPLFLTELSKMRIQLRVQVWSA